MDLIDKLEESKSIMEMFKNYINLVENVYKENNIGETIHLKNFIKDYDNKIKNIYESEPENSNKNKNFIIEEKFKFVSKVLSLLDELKYCIDFITLPSMTMDNINSTSLSYTYVLEANDSLTNLSRSWKKLYNQKIDFKIQDLDISGIREINKVFHKYPNTIDLYVNIIELYNQKYPDKKNLLNDILEADKNFYLSGVTENYFLNDKKLHIINPALSNFGLIPNSNCTDLNTLLRKVFKKDDINIFYKDLDEFSKQMEVNIISIKSISNSPVEFRVYDLLDMKVNTESITGINKKLVDSFKFIKNSGDAEFLFEYDLFDSNSSNKYLIIETLDNKTFRTKVPWNSTNEFLIPYGMIKEFISYIKGENKPMRITNYNTLCIKESNKNMFLKTGINIQNILNDSRDMDNSIIKNDVYLKIIGYINEKYNFETDDLYVITHDKEIANIFKNSLLKLYKNTGNDFGNSRFPEYELICSYLMHIQNETTKFMKELHENYTDVKKTDNLKNDVDTCLFNTIDKVITKDNMFSIINYKYTILNFTL